MPLTTVVLGELAAHFPAGPGGRRVLVEAASEVVARRRTGLSKEVGRERSC
ncbi:hypothetical protein AB0K14_02620 [Actinosynnema sp. NPDC050801]|uniref:hypothetical protein n=1 Tax=Actinosynnema sp. NPDC050801 TaxID=3155663 RepID=UPI00342BFFEF